MAREPVIESLQRDASTDEKQFLKRRDYLRLGATTAAVGTFGGAAISGSAAAAGPADDVFKQRLNAVDDLGMDPTGDVAIDEVLSDDVPADTLVEFPPGEYLVTDGFDAADGTRVGIAESAAGDVTFVFAGASDPLGDEERTATSTLLVYRENAVEVYEVRVAEFGSEPAASEGGTPRTLTIVGPSDGVANYRLTVSDRVDADAETGSQQSTGLPSTSVEDALGDTAHNYEYTGDLAAFQLDGDATVYVDGREVDPETLSVRGEPHPPNLLVFDARDDEQDDYDLDFDESDSRVVNLNDAHVDVASNARSDLR
jgi:hypothetical protein